MKGNKTRHCLVAAVMFSVSSWAFAQSATTTAAVTSAAEMSPAQIRTTTADLLQQPVYKNSWQKMVKSQKNLPAWARKGTGTSAPY